MGLSVGLVFALTCLALRRACADVSVSEAARGISLAVAMIVRDEEVNIRSNLPLWATFAECFVFMVDERTGDRTEEAVRDVLSAASRRYYVERYTFEGFGEARSLSLQRTWQQCGAASHVLIADPDWRPRLDSISLAHLNLDSQVFRFVVYDRNGMTNRRMDWLLRHRDGLRMRYALHEVLDIGFYTAVTVIPWLFDEIEKPGTWHTTVGHGNSMTARRLLFDLSLLRRDLQRYGHDPHVHYYLCTSYAGLAQRQLEEERFINETAVEESIRFCRLRSESSYAAEFHEERWACLVTLADVHDRFKVSRRPALLPPLPRCPHCRR